MSRVLQRLNPEATDWATTLKPYLLLKRAQKVLHSTYGERRVPAGSGLKNLSYAKPPVLALIPVNLPKNPAVKENESHSRLKL